MLCNQELNEPVYSVCDKEESEEIVTSKNVDESVNNVVCVRSIRNTFCGWSIDREGRALCFGTLKFPRSFRQDLERFVNRSKPALEDIYCSKSNGIEANAYALYNCHDLNQFATAHFTSKNYDKVYNAQWKVGTKMRGRTQCGRHGFAFPVVCTRREFINFLEIMLDVSREERVALFKNGIVLTEKVAVHYARVFPPGTLATPYSAESGDIFKGISMLSTIVLVLNAIQRKDYTDLGLLCVQQIEVIAPIAEYLGVAFSDFKQYIVDFMHTDKAEIQADDDPKFSWVNQLPGMVRQSPLVSKVIALATFMVSANFVKDSSLWKYLMQLIGPNFSEVRSKAFCSLLIGQVVWALWSGIKKMENFTDYESLLGLSKDGAFTEGVNEIKLMREGALSDKEAEALLQKIDTLLNSRKGLHDSQSIARMCEYLVKRKKEVMCFTSDYKAREKPIVIWLNGAPGGGKTTLIEGLKNFLAVKDGVPRKNGDTIMYNIHDPYPAEMSHCYDSRYMEINDIPADYSKYPNEGLIPLDVLLQQVIDTSPLTFQAAFDKGIIYNHIRYVFLTSNHKSYKMHGEIEKLQRRMDDSILIDISFKGTGNYGTIAALGSKVRNDNLIFTVLKAACGESRIMKFDSTQLSMCYKDFIPYLERRIDALKDSRTREYAMFNTLTCSCGLSAAHHLCKLDYVKVSPRCDLTLLKDEDHDFDGTFIGEAVVLDDDEEEEESVDEREVLEQEMLERRAYLLPIIHALSTRIPNLFTARDMLCGDVHLCRVLKQRLSRGLTLYSEVKTADVADVLRLLHSLQEFDDSFTFELPTKIGDITMLYSEGDTISDIFFAYSAQARVRLEDVHGACVAIATQVGDDPPPNLQSGLMYVHSGLANNRFSSNASLRGHLGVIRSAYVLPPNTHNMIVDVVDPQSAFVFVGWLALAINLFRQAPSMTVLQMYGLWLKLNVYFVLLTFMYSMVTTYLSIKYGESYRVREYVLNAKLTSAIFRIQKFIFDHKKTITVLGLSSIVGYAMTRSKKPTEVEAQGVTRLNYDANSLTTSVIQTHMQMKTNNRPWSREGLLRTIKLTTSNVNAEDLRTKVSRAVLPARFCPMEDPTFGCRSGYIFVLSSQAIVVNKHYLVRKDDVRALCDTYVKLDDGTEMILRQEDMNEVFGSEAIIVNCSDFPTYENLSRFLPKELPPGACFDGIYVPTGEKVVVKGENVTLAEGRGEYPAMSCKLETTKGDCGNILLGTVNGNTFIAGMLFAGLPGEHHTTYFTGIGAQEHQCCRVVVPVPEDLDPIDPGSEISNDPHSALLPLGTNASEGKQGFRTAFRETRLYPYLKDKLSETYGFPTRIAGNVSTEPGNYVHGSAWKNTFSKFDLMNYASHSLLGVCALEYVSIMPQEGPLAPLTLEQAFFGAPEIGVEGFPMKTSAGPFWRKHGCKTKQDLFVLNPETGLYEILPLFREAVQKGLDSLDQGVIVAPHVELAAKDEIRPERKLREYKIRLFSVVDADYNVLMRMYVMPIVVYLLKHKYASECFGQMHAASKQWTDLKNYLTAPGFTKFADMDFSSFDTCHDSRMFRAVSNVMLLLALHVGYSEKDAMKVKYLVESMSVQLCQYKGDYFVKTKGMPSGVILTLIINSIANSLLMRVVFCSLTHKPVSEFRNHIRLATVGDDNIHSFSDEIAENFTMSKAAPIYKQLGYTITPASKAGEFVDSMTLEELTFVKRRFVLWNDGFYRAPLDKDSIYKAFCFETKRGPEGSVERLKSVYTSGVYEAYLHGREFFDEFVKDMSSLYQQHGLPYDPITFEELDHKFLSTGITTQFA